MKKLLSILLVALIVISMVPIASVPVSASTGSPEVCSTPGIINLYWPTGDLCYLECSDPAFYRNIDGSPRWHAGLDIPVGLNSPVYAAADGVVAYVKSSYSGGLGAVVSIKHENFYNGTIYTKYCHLNQISTKEGQIVKAGDLIGYSGGSGYDSSSYYGYHLHFEIRREPVNTSCSFVYPNPAKDVMTFKWCTTGYDQNYVRGPFNYVKNTSLVGPVLGKVTITNGSSFQAGDVKFTWNAASGATSYNIKIWKIESNLTETLLYDKSGVTSGCTYNLGNGNYRYVIQAVNSSGKTETEARLFVGQKFIPSTYFIYNNNLYEVYESSKSWENANTFCNNIGGHLVTITSAEEQAVIEENIQNSQNQFLWIGASDTEKEGTFKWVTGESFNYTNWDTLGDTEPNDANGGEDYACIKTVESSGNLMGSWNDSGSATTYGFICEYENIDDMKPIASVSYNGHAYDLYDYKLPAIQAELFAQRKGGHLVSLNSEEEEDVVETLMENGSMSYYWLGAMRFDVSANKYSDKLIWSTGEEITYTNYGEGEPNNSNGEEWFVEYVRDIEDYVAWNDISNIGREARTSGFIVEKPIEYSISYNCAGALNGPENQTKIHGETIYIPDIIPERTGFRFLGWSFFPDAATVDFENGSEFTLNEDVVLYAVWQPLGELSKITISSMPKKTVYNLGEEFNSDGLVVIAEYTTGITEVLKTGYTVSEMDSATVGQKSISVYYNGKTAKFDVEVVIDSEWSDWILVEDLPEEVKNAPEGIYNIEYADGYSASIKEQKNSGYALEDGWTMESKTQIGSTSYGDWGLIAGETSDIQTEDYHTVVTNEEVLARGCWAFVSDDKKSYWYEDTSEWGNTKYTQKIFIYSSVHISSTGYGKDTDGSYKCPATIGIDTPGNFGTIYLIVDSYNESKQKILTSFTSGKDESYWWQADNKTLYRPVTEKYQYTHIRWTDWTEMSTEPVEPTDTTRVNVTENAFVRYRFFETTVADVNSVITKINSLPTEITIDDKMQIIEAQEAYKNLDDYEKSLIDSLIIQKLNAAVDTLERIDFPKHTETEIRNIKDPTCVSEGYTGDIYCLICGELVSIGESIPATGHQNTMWITEQESSCTVAGYKDEWCLDCSEKIGTEEIPATGHQNTTWVIEQEPTCDVAGYKDEYCLDCAEKVGTEEILATGHSYSTEWTIDDAPTCTEEGSKSHHCTVCGEKGDITVITSLGHDYKVVSTKEEHPHTISYKCSRCTETKEQTSTSANCAVCNFSYTNIDDETCKITGYIGNANSFVIPATINGRTVTTTTTGAFKNNTTITSVRIESGVQGLGALAFLGCGSLSKMVIPESVTNIGANAFYNCANDFTIYCYRDTYAMQYAIDNSLNYVIIDIGETENCTIDYDNKLIFATKTFSTNLEDIVYIPLSSDAFAEASLISGNKELLGTGSTVTVFDSGDLTSEYTIIVNGDLNGDSTCDVIDAAIARLYSVGLDEPTENEILAANGCVSDELDVNSYQSVVNTCLAS